MHLNEEYGIEWRRGEERKFYFRFVMGYRRRSLSYVSAKGKRRYMHRIFIWKFSSPVCISYRVHQRVDISGLLFFFLKLKISSYPMTSFHHQRIIAWEKLNNSRNMTISSSWFFFFSWKKFPQMLKVNYLFCMYCFYFHHLYEIFNYRVWFYIG